MALGVRLGILARLDPWGEGTRCGLVRLRTGKGTAEFLVELDRSPLGSSVEVRRISDAADLEAAHAAHQEDEVLRHVGAYAVLGELGRGGMGVVYRARHDETGRVVAIKVLHRELAADPRLASQFVREGRAASLANHPGIVNVTDFGKLPSGRAYLVMELVEFGTLEAVLAAGRAPPSAGRVDRASDRRRPRRRPRARGHPPRPQALQRLPRRPRTTSRSATSARRR